MSGTVKLDFGMEAMEMEWTAAGYMKELFTQWGTLRHDGVMLRFAGALQADDSESVDSLEIVVRGQSIHNKKGVQMKGNVAAIVLIVLGVFFLLTNLGLISISLRELLRVWWPVALIAVGVALFFTPGGKGR
jgi:hypothetical protein